MAKMIQVTRAGDLDYEGQPDEVISINADNINICEAVQEDEVGVTRVIFNNKESVCVAETQEQIRKLVNS